MWNHRGSATPVTTHNPTDDDGQLAGFGELLADVGPDSGDEGMAEGGSDGWIDERDERDEMDAWVVESQVGHSDGGFHWQVEDIGYDGNGRLFSSDSEDGGPDEWYFSMVNDPSDSDSEASSVAESLENDSENIVHDPLFLSRQDLFDSNHPEDGGSGEHVPDQPWAFDDHPAIRNAYIRVFLGVSFDGMTHKAASLMLNGFANAFSSAAYAGRDFPGIDRFARTIGTVEKRLGVSTEGFIIYLVLCPICWHSHLPCELSKLESPFCGQVDCPGILYSTKRLSDGTEKRTPSLILPYVPPSRAIQRMCLRPGKVAQWQHWRGPSDEFGIRPPTTDRGFNAYPDPDKLMHDITDAWGWRAIQAGLE